MAESYESDTKPMKPEYPENEDTSRLDRMYDEVVYENLAGKSSKEQGVRRYRKKPVTVEAIHNIPENKEAISQFLSNVEHAFTDEGLLIRTLEGVMKADEGDWIIRGISGEFYPCKPEIFLQTYDSV